ncbi:hypothetical protein SOVF_146340 [Spinacia oleracea]|nr:hypothetical protein SOVF_146340 [Spinacia oleracea]
MSSRKETVLDLAKFVDKGVQVKLTGGRQVTGTLKGYDQLLNLVLDEAVEYLRGMNYSANLCLIPSLLCKKCESLSLADLQKI